MLQGDCPMPFIDILILLSVIVTFAFGFFKGVIKILIAIGAFYLAIILASLYFKFLARALAANSRTSPQFLEMLCFLIIFVVAFLIFLWAGLYTFRYVKISGRLQYLDKVLGSLAGLVLGALFASMFAMMFRYLFITYQIANTIDYPFLVELQASTKNSFFSNIFLRFILPAIYTPLSPILPENADIVFRGLGAGK
jgi:uncharacterized membrane protein required for colicin V production